MKLSVVGLFGAVDLSRFRAAPSARLSICWANQTAIHGSFYWTYMLESSVRRRCGTRAQSLRMRQSWHIRRGLALSLPLLQIPQRYPVFDRNHSFIHAPLFSRGRLCGEDVVGEHPLLSSSKLVPLRRSGMVRIQSRL